MFDRFGYKSALYLSALIAAVNGSFVAYQLANSLRTDGIDLIFIAALLIFVGLWLLSKGARSLGAIFYVLCVGVIAFAFFKAKMIVVTVGVLWAALIGLLSLCSAAVLIFSKSFVREFEAERQKRPTFKKYLGNALATLIVILMVVMTSFDLVHLLSR